MSDEDRLRQILRDDPITWRALREAKALDLPDWWIVSGALYNTAWNALTRRPPGYGIKDIDLFYYHRDLSYDAEDREIKRGQRHFAPTPPVEIRNQARVHLWYEAHFGRPIDPLPDCQASIRDFASETHAIGARLVDDEIDIYAPFGLAAVFEMRMVPNLRNPNRATHEAKGSRAKALWPDLVIEPWPKEPIVRSAKANEDWGAVLDLLRRAFRSMDGRIDPPSSLHEMTVASLEQKSTSEQCFLAFVGATLTGCIFCAPARDHLYVAKLAVAQRHQGQGIGRALLDAAETYAQSHALPALQLQTRVELTENHAAFTKLGFVRTGETNHPGYDRATSITMRKAL